LEVNMSKSYKLPIVNGVYTGYKPTDPTSKGRALGFSVAGSGITGTVSVKGRFPGASYFELIPTAANVPLSAPYSIQFFGPVYEYEVTLSGVAGVTSLSMTEASDE
jgi:hypothetical protein